MALNHVGTIELPAHSGTDGFDHADIHVPSDRLYVAHTANDAVDVIDLAGDRYVESIAGFKGVAGALVAGRIPGRRAPDDITLFDSSGTGIQDVAAAARAYELAVARGVGTRVDLT